MDKENAKALPSSEVCRRWKVNSLHWRQGHGGSGVLRGSWISVQVKTRREQPGIFLRDLFVHNGMRVSEDTGAGEAVVGG